MSDSRLQVFQEIAGLQRQLDAQIGEALTAIEGLLSDYTALKATRKKAKAAMGKKASTRNTFLATPGSVIGVNDAQFSRHMAKGVVAINAAQTADRLHAEWIEALAQIRTNTRVGFSTVLQELAQATLRNHRETGQLAVVVSSDITLGSSASRAAEALQVVRGRIQLVEADLGTQGNLDRTALEDPSSVAPGDDPKAKTAATDLLEPQFGTVFEDVALPGDETDREYLDRLKRQERDVASSGVPLHKWMHNQVTSRSRAIPKEGVLLRRERAYGLTTAWRSSYFVCRRFAFVQIGIRGNETTICQNLRGAIVKKRPASEDVPRHYMFQLKVAEQSEPLLLQATCFRELTEWTTSLQRVIDGGML